LPCERQAKKQAQHVSERRQLRRQTGADGQAENRAEQVNARRQLERQTDAVVVFVDDKRTRRKKRRKQHTKEEREKVRVRVQKFRENLTETAREKIRAHDKEYRRKRKKMKIDKPISDMSTRQQRAQRKRWAHYSRAYRRRKKLMDEQSTAAAYTIMGRASSSRKLVVRHRVCIARSKVARELLKTQEELKRERQLQQQKVLMQSIGNVYTVHQLHQQFHRHHLQQK